MSEVAIIAGAERASHGAVGAALRILMVRHGVGVDDAFEMLVRASRRSRLALRDVAAGIVRASPGDRSGPRAWRLDRPWPERPGSARRVSCRGPGPVTPGR